MVGNIPFRLRCAMDGYAAGQTCRTFSLSQVSDIDNVAENIGECMAIPQKRAAIFLLLFGNNPVFKPIAARRWNTTLIEHSCDCPVSEPFGAPLINLLDDRRGFRVDNQVVFV